MATVIEPPATTESSATPAPRKRTVEKPTWERVLAPLASLKLTVWLFAASLFIVLAGTFAQTRADIWAVIDMYFRFDPGQVFTSSFPFLNVSALFVWIDGALFFPPAFAPEGPPVWATKVGFPFPKGWTIGVVLILNLLAAHAIRFKVQARGSRLIAGLATTVLGTIFTYLVIAAGGSNDGFQTDTWVSYDVIWNSVEASLLILACAAGWGFAAMDRERAVERYLVLAGGVGSLLLFLYLLATGDTRLDDAYMRILWQLIKATLAGLVLLVGCILLFKKRAGIVLLHAGVSLMMVGEIMVGLQATESKMTIEEGRASNYSEDTRDWELVVIDPDPADAPGSLIEKIVPNELVAGSDTPVPVDGLPFALKIREFEPSSYVQEASGRDEKQGLVVATAGVGTDAVIRRLAQSKGTDSVVDTPSAYVDVVDTESGETLETLLLSTRLDEQNIAIGDKIYQFDLRFKRAYKPYAVYLNEMIKEEYIGTQTPKDFSAYVTLADPTTGVVSDQRIWMNNPLRYAGETFYQANFDDRRGVQTGIQIVSNQGWMIPYVACMVVAVGMIFQFGQSILRFIDRRRRPKVATEKPQLAGSLEDGKPGPIKTDGPKYPDRSTGELLAGTLAVLLAGAIIAVKILPPSFDDGEANTVAFGALPVVKGGRVKPLDTLARNSLLQLSDKQTAKRAHPDPEKAADGKLLSVDATHWLLDVIARTPTANDYRVFRIENLEVLKFMELERREGLLYSMNELLPVLAPQPDENGVVPRSKFDQQLAVLKQIDFEPDQMTFFQKKLVDLYRKLNVYRGLQIAFDELPLPRVESPQELGAAIRGLQEDIVELPRTIPVLEETRLDPSADGWMSFAEADLIGSIERIARGEEADPPKVSEAVSAFDAMLTTWSQYSDTVRELEEATYGEEADPKLAAGIEADLAAAATTFNAAVGQFNSFMATEVANGDATGPAEFAVNSYQPSKLGFESFFNRFAPFHMAWILYIFAAVLALGGLLIFPRELRSAALAMILLTFALHTFALWARIYISGRPPVTNLYSSAVFIGWAAVLFGIGLEFIYKMGVGNIISVTAGILTLRIAHVLSMDGDTFEVLQAVLDTQFWLATHVVTITLGYSATFVAGLLAAVGIFRGLKSDDETDNDVNTLARMTYGVTCFAMLFSFVGTVLGGLWADDSWGRFWGWDPKENGALMIVLANALVLHARWGKMIGNRGLFVLAVLSNIIVAWSWFGTNELGVGLHSYGFTEGRLKTLAIFILSQLIIAVIAFFPRLGNKGEKNASEAPAIS